MEQLLTTLVSYVLGVYLPIEDVGSRITISIAVTGLIIQFSKVIIEWLKKLNIFDYFSKNSEITIDYSNPIHNKIIKWIEVKHMNKVSSWNMNNNNGKNILIPTKIKKNHFEEVYYHNSICYNIKISLSEAPRRENNNKNDRSKKDVNIYNVPQIMLKSAAPIPIVEKYLNDIVQNFNTCIYNKIPIYNIIVDTYKDSRTFEWNCNVTKLSKNMKNTIVSDTVRKNFYDDIEIFIKSEEKYLEKGLPYKRGYILYGPPGCGKTSLIKAVANQYKLPIFIFDMSIIKDNEEFVKIANQIRDHLTEDQNYLVVFEDVDRCKMFDRWSAITSDCLLNIMDGLDEYHGRITIMTTNDLEKIKNINALIRPGRLDVITEVTYCTTTQIHGMLMQHLDINDYDKSKYDLNPNIVITPALLTQIISTSQNIDNIITILNKQIDFTKINIEKMNDIYTISKNDDQCGNIEKICDDSDSSEEDNNTRIKKYYASKTKKIEKRISIMQIKIDQTKNNIENLSELEKLQYEKLCSTKKILEIQQNNIQREAEIKIYMDGLKQEDEGKDENKKKRSGYMATSRLGSRRRF